MILRRHIHTEEHIENINIPEEGEVASLRSSIEILAVFNQPLNTWSSNRLRALSNTTYHVFVNRIEGGTTWSDRGKGHGTQLRQVPGALDGVRGRVIHAGEPAHRLRHLDAFKTFNGAVH